MNQISQQVEIQWPVTALFNYVSDITNNAEWQNNVVKSEWIKRTGKRVGSTFAEVRNVKGQEFFAEVRVTEFVPNQKRTVKINSDAHLLCSMQFVPLSEEETKLTLQLTWDKNEELAAGYDLLKLKEILENNYC
ncbi:MAG TPA: SRPBCC family protein [Cyclobacteriaceae bacterium]